MTQIERWLREEGRKEGKEEKGIEIALAMLKEGYPLEAVVKITKLDEKTVFELVKQSRV